MGFRIRGKKEDGHEKADYRTADDGHAAERGCVRAGGGRKTVPVGAFKYKDPFAEIDGPGIDLPNNPNSRMFMPEPAVAEIVITNELTPRPVNLPRTGDESDALLWACAALVSGAAAVLLMRRKCRA